MVTICIEHTRSGKCHFLKRNFKTRNIATSTHRALSPMRACCNLIYLFIYHTEAIHSLLYCTPKKSLCPIRYSQLWLMGYSATAVICQYVLSVTVECTWWDTRCFLGDMNNFRYKHTSILKEIPYVPSGTVHCDWWDILPQ